MVQETDAKMNPGMNYDTLSAAHDPMGAAIRDFYLTGKVSRLQVLSTMFDDDEMPVAHLFRTYDEMPPLERIAIDVSRGRVLDVGAGAGCHSLVLQQRGHDVKAIDISPLGCEVMLKRGVSDVECVNVFNPLLHGAFDTILLLMNGTGIAGKLSRLPILLNRLKELMADGAQILIDSSDLRYLYEDEEGLMNIDFGDAYYGEVDYRMVYRGIKGAPFDWLYADPIALADCCRQCGLFCEIMAHGNHYDYLARITK